MELFLSLRIKIEIECKVNDDSFMREMNVIEKAVFHNKLSISDISERNFSHTEVGPCAYYWSLLIIESVQ